MARRGTTYGMFYDREPEQWMMYCVLVLPQLSDDDQTAVKIGLSIQSPTGSRTRAMFRDVVLTEEAIRDFHWGVKKTGPED
jgi:hypothetical protein